MMPADWAAVGAAVLLLLTQLVSDTSNWFVVVLCHGCFFIAVSPPFHEVTLGGRGLKHLSLAICFQVSALSWCEKERGERAKRIAQSTLK